MDFICYQKQTTADWDASLAPNEHKREPGLHLTRPTGLPQMTSDPKNKGTLFSPTLKVEEGKVHSFS